jgi:hypothetical protein
MADKLAMRCHLRGGCAETGCHIPTGRVGLGQPDDLASRPNAGGLYRTLIGRRHDMLVPRRTVRPKPNNSWPGLSALGTRTLKTSSRSQ